MKDAEVIHTRYFTYGKDVKYCDEYVYMFCLSIRPSAHISQKPHGLQSSLNSVHTDCGRGSVLFWQRCDTLCTSGFADDVAFPHSGPYGTSCIHS